jgi:acyl carrier protein
MTEAEAISNIKKALEKTLKHPTEFDRDADLIESNILDSLDANVFALELETITNKRFPEDADLVEQGFFKVPKLIEFLTS